MKLHITLWLGGLLLTSMLYGCNQDQETAQFQQNKPIHMHEVNDKDVTSNVKTALSMIDEFNNLDITIVTTKGDVLLTGEVENVQQLDSIGKLVATIDGVHAVHNHLIIR